MHFLIGLTEVTHFSGNFNPLTLADFSTWFIDIFLFWLSVSRTLTHALLLCINRFVLQPEYCDQMKLALSLALADSPYDYLFYTSILSHNVIILCVYPRRVLLRHFGWNNRHTFLFCFVFSFLYCFY